MAKKKLTPEEIKIQDDLRKENLLKRDLSEILACPYPRSPYGIKVGDSILDRTGNRGELKVLEVIESGRAFIVELKNGEKQAVASTAVVPPRVQTDSQIARPYRKHINFGNQMIESLIHKHYKSGIKYDPPYQRGLCWSAEDKVALIDSIFGDVEIGKFVFVELKYDENQINGGPGYEILDGKQRLSTIIEFFEDRFTYKGLTFSQLSGSDRDFFLDRCMPVGTVSEEWTMTDKVEYFLRMNVAGVPQSREHIKNVENLLNELKTEVKNDNK